MINNPFTPSEIASDPGDFFGRSQELQTFGRSLMQGSIVVEGPIGIGKSSLVARGRLRMEGFGSDYTAQSIVAVGDRDLQTIDDAARLVLESFTEVDERRSSVKFKVGTVFEVESAELCRYFQEGRHLAALKRLIESTYLSRLLSGRQLLLIAIDEADKCPAPLARLIRAVTTDAQQKGIKNVRFAVAGVSPLYQQLVTEDPGISRFFNRTISLVPLTEEESYELVSTKLTKLAEEAEDEGIRVDVDPQVVSRVVALSGGHPHILQLLGSHLVEHENDDPDGVIDSRDLTNSLRRICYEDRAGVYRSMIHWLESAGKLDTLLTVLGMSPEVSLDIISPGVPTRINRSVAREYCDTSAIQWLVDNNFLYAYSAEYYGLIDEFLRIRLMMDRLDRRQDEVLLEQEYISPHSGAASRARDLDPYPSEEDD